MPIPDKVDVAILGAGTAGLGARRAVQRAGLSVRLFDGGALGTTCARVGCMPSKLLIAAADRAHDARTGEVFGVHADVRVDGPAVLGRVREERDRFVGFVEKTLEEADAAGELTRSHARLVAPGVLEADGEAVHFERLVIATGSSPRIPGPYRDLPEGVLLTSADVFELDDLPSSVLVVGLGPIGLELGQALHRLGVRVTLLGLGGRIATLEDPEVRAAAARALGRELELYPDHTLDGVEAGGDGVVVRFTDADGASHERTFARVLVAAGRTANLQGFGLEAAYGVGPDDDGRWPIDRGTLQLGDHPVFVAGDANGLHPLLHEAVDDGRIAGENAARWPEALAPRRRTPLAMVFTRPELAVVGEGFDAFDNDRSSAGAVDFGDQGRARVEHRHAGRVRVYADARSHRLLGAELCAPGAEHLAHLIAWAVQAGLTAEDAAAMPFYHPTLEEGLRTALRGLATALKAQQPVDCKVAEQGVGS